MNQNEKKPTPSQLLAINTREKNLLVSAGAGSGKTTVLTQRLIERIKNGDSVTDFLVVTFMKAAASDIKGKLYTALNEAAATEADPKKQKHLYRQMLLVQEADICTISSYCLGLVRENFALLGISPNARVIDETEAAMLLSKVADSLIEKGYEKQNEAFLRLADNFSGDKNDEPLLESMIKLYNTLRVTVSYGEMLRTCAEKLNKEADLTEEKGFFQTDFGRELQERLYLLYGAVCERANGLYSESAAFADEKYRQPLLDFANSCRDVQNAVLTNYVNFCHMAANAGTGIRLASKGCDEEKRDYVKEQKKDISKELKKLFERYCRGDEAMIANSFRKTAELVACIAEFLADLDKAYNRAKHEISALDYTDFEEKALELLETKDEKGNPVPSELCLKKQKCFKEILIDEYQDVNPMQDRIFTLLSGGSYRFMVGDVKQSIYRFRNAYPDIFNGYKDEFSRHPISSDSENGCIFLKENFRCSEAVISYVNHLFKTVTENTQYYSDYEGQWLVHALPKEARPHPVTVAVANRQSGKSREARQSEAEYIAQTIVKLVNKSPTDDGSQLNYKFKDIAVMLGAMKGYSIEYEKAFRKYNIPYVTETSENFLENPDIRLAVSALKAIDSPSDDIALCSLMRSPICNFDSQDLYSIRKCSEKTEFFEALVAFAAPKAKRTAGRFRFKKEKGAHCLTVRCREFLRRLTAWRRESAGVPCREFLKGFFVSSGILNIAISSGNRQSLLLLYDYACRYESNLNMGLSAFLDYIAELSKSGKEIPDAARAGEENAVHFITVHKSKGLEFKVCFLAGTEKQFKSRKSGNDITVLRREGVYFRLRDRDAFTTYDPICNVIAADKEQQLQLGEELRKLYVALTRAKERLYITGSIENGKDRTVYSPLTAKNWLELVLYCHSMGEAPFVNVESINDSNGEQTKLIGDSKPTYAATAEMLGAVEYTYPHGESVKTAAKISVSELREGLLEDDEYNRTSLSVPISRVSLKPNFASGDAFDAAEIGTANHVFMQFCDFANIEAFSAEAEAKRLAETKMLTEAQWKMLDFGGLKQFFASELYKRIRASKRVYREKRFSVRDTLGEKGEVVLVQGVIDCFFENPDGTFTVVDYKTDRVNSPQQLVERHRVQLACYCRAVEGMTGKRVSEALLYSFALGREVKL